MTALIVGADRIEPIREELVRSSNPICVTHTEHWSGRKAGDLRRVVPDGTRLIVVVCDRVNHSLLASVRRQAGKLGVPMIYCRHSLLDLRQKLAGIRPPASESRAQREHVVQGRAPFLRQTECARRANQPTA
jgi:hypothetical protein